MEEPLIVVVDIGNTHTVVGACRGRTLALELRLKTDTQRTHDEYAATLLTLFERKFGSVPKVSQAVICSVVPPLTNDLAEVVEQLFGVKPIIVGPGTKTNLQIKVQEPQSVGADRVVNALAAKELFGIPSLVVDFGTATSFDVVGPEGDYEGGAIAPGMMTALDALVRNTAKLPRIEFAWPKSVIGKNTVHAMQAGAIRGYAHLVDGLISDIITERGPFKHIIATGGLGRFMIGHAKKLQQYEPNLTLIGMVLVAERNR